ncbi:MAG: NAD-dependent epimerase/dehydratase family protein [Anaerolineales bacterium]|nr:NAD-dependent epimerase/dehydratase family protein [Anaerolineales bacterium]
MKYFVTGATGFVGGRVARLLRAEGHAVNALVRQPAAAAALAALGVQLFPGDVTDPASLPAGMRGVDGVFHIAGWYKIGQRDKRPGQRVNVEGTRHVLTAMRDLGIPKGVYTSTLAVNSDTHGAVADESYHFHGRHLSEYDRTKAAAHDLAREFSHAGLPLVIVMPGGIYGPGDTSSLGESLRQYLQRRLPLLPSGTALTFAHVDDVARAHLLALEQGHAGQSYIIAGPAHTLIDFFQTAEAITGVPAPRLHAPPGLLRAAAALMGLLEKVVPIEGTYNSESLRVLAGVTYLGTNAKARRELGYAPRDLREGLTETFAELLEKRQPPQWAQEDVSR